jgi:hypothetical protein
MLRKPVVDGLPIKVTALRPQGPRRVRVSAIRVQSHARDARMSTLVSTRAGGDDCSQPMQPPVDIPARLASQLAAMARVPLLVIVGPPGVGKSAVGKELTRLLAAAGSGFAYIDRDDFGVGGLLHEDPLLDLNEMLHARVAAGARRLVVVWRVESGHDVARIRAALGWADITVCRLRADPGELLARIAAGQPEFQSLHLQTMALQIAPRLEHQAGEDIVLATDDAPPGAVALGVMRQWAMRGAPPAGDAAA